MQCRCSFAQSGTVYACQEVVKSIQPLMHKRHYRLFYYLCIATIKHKSEAFFIAQWMKSSKNNALLKRSMAHIDTTASMEIPWRFLLEESITKTCHIRGSNYVQLATVEQGEPRCRTIVFRGFLDVPSHHRLANEYQSHSCIMQATTDLRSNKVRQIHKTNKAELVWWFPSLNEQYRIRGNLILVGEDTNDSVMENARRDMWKSLSRSARESFQSLRVPSEPLLKEHVSKQHIDSTVVDNTVSPPVNFLLMVLNPYYVDYLCLSGNHHRQVETRGETGWSNIQRINP